MAESIELRPGAGQMILSVASKSGMNLTAAVRELADNSLDAKAKTIVFSYSSKKNTFSVVDDGIGTASVADIVTLFKHKDHVSTESGRFGFGGTASHIWLTKGLGKVSVTSHESRRIYSIVADYRRMVETDDLRGDADDPMPNKEGRTGTEIIISGCRPLTANDFGNAKRILSFTFAPALRKGASIVFEVDGKREALSAYAPPAHKKRIKFSFEVDGLPVKGFCDLVKPGETNRGRGWSIIHGHRIVNTYKDPAGERNLDFGLIYSETVLPKEWKTINDLKEGFTEYPQELMDKLSEACSPLLDSAEKVGQTFELKLATKAVQELFDKATGYSGPSIKEKRPGKPGTEGTAEPKYTGRTRDNYKVAQPGDRPSAGSPSGQPRRIIVGWSPTLEQSIDVSPAGSVVRVDFSESDPSNLKYRTESGSQFLFDIAALAVSMDAKTSPDVYRGLFPGIMTGEAFAMFDQLRAANRAAASSTDAA